MREKRNQFSYNINNRTKKWVDINPSPYLLSGEGCWKFELCHEHECFFHCEMREESIILPHVSGASPDHGAGTYDAVEMDVTRDQTSSLRTTRYHI